MVTLFTSCKPFVKLVQVFQTNALTSWCQQEPKPTVICYGNDVGTKEICGWLGLNHMPDCPTDEHGLPILSFMFSVVDKFAETPYACFANADIVITGFLGDIAAKLDATFSHGFLGVARRWDLPLDEPMVFAPGWRGWLVDRIRMTGELYSACSSDLFLFKRPLGFDLETFTIGRPRWDNWMMWKACQMGMPIVDITEAAIIAHPRHEYGPNLNHSRKLFFKHESSRRNEILAAEGGAFCQKHAMKVGNLFKINSQHQGYEISQLK